MFRPYTQDQMMLLPPCLKEFLGDSHPVHMINDLVEKMNLSVLEKRYGTMGQPAYHPRLMLKVILYGFSVGTFSARKLARACRENLAFQSLTGGDNPAFKTFIEFRRRHQEDMKEVFLETVKLARQLGLKSLGAVALDGTKIQADTSKHKAMSYGRMLEEEKRLKGEIEDLLKKAEATDAQEDQEFGTEKDGYSLEEKLSFRQERLRKIEEAKAALEEREKKDHPDKPIDPKKQISFADTEARCFSKKSEGTRYVHNAQATVEMETQLIVENHIEDSVSDAGAVEATLTNLEEGLGMKTEKVVIDGGYANTQTLESCQRHGVTPVCAAGRETKDASPLPERLENVNAFSYDEKINIFTCPHGTAFTFDHWNDKNNVATYVCRGTPGCTCGSGVKQRGVRVRRSHLARRELQRILVMHKELYGRRKTTVEPVFGQIKAGMGFRRWFYRGKKKVGSEWNVVCAAFNIRKIAALIRAGVFTTPTPMGSPDILDAQRTPLAPFLRENAYHGRLFRHWIARIKLTVAPLAYCG